jgi:hypothetical protein
MLPLISPDQDLQDRINTAVTYARGLRYLDEAGALKLLVELPSEVELRRRHSEILGLASAFERTSHLKDAMRRARDELEDAAVGRLVEVGEGGDDEPPFWGFDGDRVAWLVLGVRVHAGSLIVDGPPEGETGELTY